MIPPLPSAIHDCYYFTNNPQLIDQLRGTQWKPVFVDKPVNDDYYTNTLLSKELKAAPHHAEQLRPYALSFYFDSKWAVSYTDIEPILTTFRASSAVIALGKHPSCNTIMDEYNEAMKHERYAAQKDRLLAYMNRYGIPAATTYRHHCSGFILRKNTPLTSQINDTWYTLIQEFGTECQISLSYVVAKFRGKFMTTNACAKFTGKDGSPLQIL